MALRTMDLGPDMSMSWMNDGTTITMTVTGPDTGSWMGIGISASGGMKGADIMVGKPSEDGTGLDVVDMFSHDYVTPVVDAHQDLKVIEQGVEDGKRYFTFQRDILTCDEDDDFDILDEPQRIMWAHGTSEYFSYHTAAQRGTQYVNLLDGNDEILPDEDVETVDLVMNAYEVPSRRTTYVCQQFEIPSDKPYHMVKFEPITDSKYMHHIIAMGCGGPLNDEVPVAQGEPFTCDMLGGYKDYDAPPRTYETDGEEGDEDESSLSLGACAFDIMMATAVGSNSVQFPDAAGRLVGEGASRYVLMQMHYDNIDGDVGGTDSSGMRMYITPNLRPNNIGSLLLGDLGFKIPGKSSAYEVVNECPGGCTASIIPPGGITITNFILHQHLFGKSLWTKHVRDGRELQEVGRTDYWDFAFQPFEKVKEGIVVMPGDSLVTHCVFDTYNRPRSGLTDNDWDYVGETGLNFGDATTNEMCINIVMYYPQISAPENGMGFCMDTSTWLPNSAVCTGGSSADMGGFSSSISMGHDFVTKGDDGYEPMEIVPRVCVEKDDGVEEPSYVPPVEKDDGVEEPSSAHSASLSGILIATAAIFASTVL